MTDVTSHRRH